MLDYDEEVVKKLEIFIDNYLEKQREKYKGNAAVEDKLDHIEMVTLLSAKLFPDDALLRVAAKMHDIGRFEQFELCGSFADTKVLHHYLGEDTISRLLYRNEIEPSDELDVIRYVIQYHGREKFLPYKVYIPAGVKDIVSDISRVDDIENGCIGAVGYLEREEEEDSKGYKTDNPGLDQQSVSEEVMDFYSKGEKFDKLKYCHTYAEYVLFAATLAITRLQSKDRDIAKMALEGYEQIFKKMLSPEIADECYKIFYDYYENDKRDEINKRGNNIFH